MTKIAINGMGRIGRAALKIALDTPELKVVAVNDIVPLDNIAYLLKYDTAYGRFEKRVDTGDIELIIEGQSLSFLSEKDPAQLPWDELGVDIVLECTGIFTRREDLEKHRQAGAHYVILSAPAKGDDVPTIVFGVNQPLEDEHIISTASCTTNCITPVVEIMGRRIGIQDAVMTTIHAYTSSQAIVDSPSKKIRRGRAGAANFVPTSTGAAIATTKVLPEYEGHFDGVAVRGPVPVGSISDMVFVTERNTTIDEVNGIFREEAQTARYQGILGTTDDPLVSSDIIGDSHASLVDTGMTQVINGHLVKIMSWYDNEWGYTSQMVRTAVALTERAEVLSA
ncbi:MAG: type I glyceraldehyde-3-phosphate dehydrogenase [Chloroflexi bacterium]|nr:type I glyceraldehyde-3-phosphate dehydrogenase [Chloroflexota bacterium]